MPSVSLAKSSPLSSIRVVRVMTVSLLLVVFSPLVSGPSQALSSVGVRRFGRRWWGCRFWSRRRTLRRSSRRARSSGASWPVPGSPGIQPGSSCARRRLWCRHPRIRLHTIPEGCGSALCQIKREILCRRRKRRLQYLFDLNLYRFQNTATVSRPEGTRTLTGNYPPADSKSAASANFATGPRCGLNTTKPLEGDSLSTPRAEHARVRGLRRPR